MQTKPGGGQGGSVLVVVETGTRMWLCLATLARSKALLLSETFKSRPFTFGAALDPSLAAVALNILNVGAGDVLLDPCTGTGTILVGGVERGALAIGMDQNFKFACGCRANLDYLGLASVGGGFLRQRASAAWDGRCVVANHDARIPFSPEFPSLPTPTVIVTNVPHGRSNTRVRCCSGTRRAARARALSLARPLALYFKPMRKPCVRESRAPDLGMLWDRYLVLPYPGYLRDIIANLCACAPAARFCFIGGEGCTQDPGPDNLIEVWVSATLAHSYGMLRKRQGRLEGERDRESESKKCLFRSVGAD
jgi:hypothetical protein